MSRTIWLGGIAGGVLLFLWGVLAWDLLPLHSATLRALPGEDQVVSALVSTGTKRGFYVIPGLPRDAAAFGGGGDLAAERSWEEKHRRGPLGVLVYEPRGRPPNRMFRPMLRGLVLSLLAGMFAAWSLSRVELRGYSGRFLFVLGLGGFAWLLGPAMDWNWFHYPVDYTSIRLLNSLLGWTIVGAVQAGIVKR